MYQKWLREAGYWLPHVDESSVRERMYREMNMYLKYALHCFMAEECM